MRLSFHPFVTDSMIYGGAKVMHAGLFFLAIVIVTRHLSPDDYGHAALFQSAVLFFTPFLDFSTLIQRAYHHYSEEELFHYLRGAFAACFVRAAQLAALLAVAGWGISHSTGLECLWLFMALLVALLQGLVMLCHGYWQAARSVWLRTVTWVGYSMVYCLLAWVFVTLQPLGWLAPVVALGLATLLAMLACVGLLWRQLVLLRLDTSRGLIRKILGTQRLLLSHQVSAPLYIYASQFIVAHYLPMKEVGMLALAIQCATIVNLYADSLMPALVPWIQGYLKTPTALQRMHLRYIVAGFLVLLMLISMATALLAPWLVPFMADAGYQEAAAYVPWICAAYFFHCLVKLLGLYVLFYTEWFRAVSKAAIQSMLLYVILIFVLVQANGIKGAIAAMMLGFLFRTLLWLQVARKVYRHHPLQEVA